MWQIGRLAVFIVLLSYFSPAEQPYEKLSTEEYAVMGAMLDGFRSSGHALHPIVADYTSTLNCESICNGMKIGRCNGLTGNDETPKERLAIVKRDLPNLDQTIISDFESKNRQCSKISEKIPSRSAFFLFGNDHTEKLPSGWEHADFLYFSRVGFNSQHTQALVNVSFYSGTSAADTGGKYFLLVNENGKWVAKGSSIVWQASR
ncbi:MAG: hypothetical protein WBM04_18925 [Candidatus Korobacteraceae bacterium]